MTSQENIEDATNISKDYLLELIKLHNTNRLDYDNRKWETAKFFQTIVSGLIVVVVAGIITILNEKNFYYASIRIGLSILAAISALSAVLAMANLKHESRLLFLEELQIFKIAKLMKLDCTVPDNFRWLPNDKYFLSQKWRDTKYGTSGRLGNTPEDWVIARLRGHGFFGTITCLFITEIIASIILIITIWSI